MTDPLSPPSLEDRAHARWPIVVVIVIALLAMGRASVNDWAYFDDDLFLFRNPHYDPPTLDSLGHYWTHGFRGLWTPVTHTAWWFVAKLALLDVAEPGGVRLNPWMFHAFNVLLHATTSVLVFLLVRRVVRSSAAAVVGAACFAAHPVQVEAVAWTCGTKDLLAALFTMAALLAGSGRGRATVFWTIAFAMLAMLSKPSAVVLPAMLACLAWMTAADEGSSRRWRVPVVVTALLAVPVLVIARQVQAVADVPHVALLARPLVAGDALAMHLWHIAWPVNLITDYGLTPPALFNATRRWWTWLVPVIAALLAWRSRDRIVIRGLALFAIALAPNLGLAAFQFQVYSTVADRYAYPAMLGVAIVLARLLVIVERRVSSRAPSVIATGVIAVTLVPISFRYCGDWHDGSSLWSRTILSNPSSALARNNLGSVAMARGDFEIAIQHFEQASQHESVQGFALLNLVQIHLRLGDAPAACDAAVRLVESYRRRGDFDPALERQTIDHFMRELARLDPAAAEQLRQRTQIVIPAR